MADARPTTTTAAAAATATGTVDPAQAMAAIRDARPPATDRFTYLTILESHLSPAVLPALYEVLQDPALTQDIGWDLVYNLVNLPGAEGCLETIARLGNPREVILKVLEALDLLLEDEGYQGDDEGDDENDENDETPPKPPTVSASQKFIVLLGMLAILHRRIRTRRPSRFLAQTLQAVLRAYRPSQEMTAASINLVHSLSGRRRPPLPTRRSSVNVANPDQDGDASRNAPDPEADDEELGGGSGSTSGAGTAGAGAGGNGGGEGDDTEDPTEGELQQRMLLSFATCVLEAYVNGNDMGWAGRLVEFYAPEKIVPGKRTLMAAFREDVELLERDAMVGQLMALTKDLGLLESSQDLIAQLSKPTINNPLAKSDDASSPDDIPLSTGSCISLVAYWVFSSTLFDADQPRPAMNIFPEHSAILRKFLLQNQNDVESSVLSSPGTAQSIVTLGLWLEANGLLNPAAAAATASITPLKSSSNPAGATTSEEPASGFMSYLHSLTLIAVFHPLLHVRNAAITLAGLVLHADPADDDRLRILDDLLENCVFAHLKARAVTWLREEFLHAAAAASSSSSSSSSTATATNASSVFAGPAALETVQYALFPNMSFLLNAPPTDEKNSAADNKSNDLTAVQYLVENAPFLLQAANLALFLWGSSTGAAGTNKWRHLLPANLDATVAERWLEPLRQRLERLGPEFLSGGGGGGPVIADLEVLRDRLARLAETEAFKAREGGVH